MARSRWCQGSPHPPSPGMPGDRGRDRQRQLPPPSRGPPRRRPPLHDSPGPAQVAPSVGLGAREPGSPRGLLIGGPPSPPSSQQPPDASRRPVLDQQRRGSRQALRAGAPRALPSASGKLRARRRGGPEAGGAESKGQVPKPLRKGEGGARQAREEGPVCILDSFSPGGQGLPVRRPHTDTHQE